MNDREHRLRMRIDQLTDQRDDARAKLLTLRKHAVKLRRRLTEVEHSRELWRHRARQWRPTRR